jgi:hypothetical protein
MISLFSRHPGGSEVARPLSVAGVLGTSALIARRGWCPPGARGAGGVPHAVWCGGRDCRRRDAELAVEPFVGRGSADVLQAHDAAGVADDLAPALSDSGPDADPGPRRWWQYLVLIGQ